jgi:hypothetical protein
MAIFFEDQGTNESLATCGSSTGKDVIRILLRDDGWDKSGSASGFERGSDDRGSEERGSNDGLVMLIVRDLDWDGDVVVAGT